MRTVDSVAEPLDARGAEEAALEAEHFLAVERHDGARRPVDVPEVAGLRVDADHVDDVARRRARRARRSRPRTISAELVEPGRAGDERTRQIRLDVARRNARDRFDVERLTRVVGESDRTVSRDSERRRGWPSTKSSRTTSPGIDEVRVADLRRGSSARLPASARAPSGTCPRCPTGCRPSAPYRSAGARSAICTVWALQRRAAAPSTAAAVDAQGYAKLLTHKTLPVGRPRWMLQSDAPTLCRRQLCRVLAIVLNRRKIRT